MRQLRPWVYASILLLSAAAHAASTLPEFTGDWVNGGPYTTAGLKGKGILIFLMEPG